MNVRALAHCESHGSPADTHVFQMHAIYTIVVLRKGEKRLGYSLQYYSIIIMMGLLLLKGKYTMFSQNIPVGSGS